MKVFQLVRFWEYELVVAEHDLTQDFFSIIIFSFQP